MKSIQFKKGEKAARNKVIAFIDQMIKARLDWANSPEGRKALGPGSPTIPGMQDMCVMRAFVAKDSNF